MSRSQGVLMLTAQTVYIASTEISTNNWFVSIRSQNERLKSLLIQRRGQFSRLPCYVFCICPLTYKYQKYKSVELGDQLRSFYPDDQQNVAQLTMFHLGFDFRKLVWNHTSVFHKRYCSVPLCNTVVVEVRGKSIRHLRLKRLDYE